VERGEIDAIYEGRVFEGLHGIPAEGYGR